MENTEKLIEHKDIENTPIVGVKLQEKWFGMIGRSKVTRSYETFEKLEESIENIGVKDWEQLLGIIAGYIHSIQEEILTNIKENNDGN